MKGHREILEELRQLLDDCSDPKARKKINSRMSTKRGEIRLLSLKEELLKILNWSYKKSVYNVQSWSKQYIE